MLFEVTMEIQPLLYQRNQKVFLILMFVMQMSLLRRFLSDCFACFCNGAHTVPHSVKVGKGPAANIV